jgi:hypothetical protein
VLVRRKNLICVWLEAESKTHDLSGEQLAYLDRNYSSGGIVKIQRKGYRGLVTSLCL